MGTAYRDIDFICNGKISNGSTISDDSVLCIRGIDPSPVDDGLLGMVLVPVPAATQA
jgi:hypothetical protein